MMIVETEGKTSGSVYAVLKRPPLWKKEMVLPFPQLVSLIVKKEYRNQGAGTFLIRAVEKEVRSRGHGRIHLGVDPLENPGAKRL